MPEAARADTVIRIGISACLLGRKVRYDGGHKRDDFLVETFGPLVHWVPFCPEVELGLGTPRETLRLVRAADGVRMTMPKSGRDFTDEMQTFARKRVAAMRPTDLCGFVLKKDSPSCGMERVKVYDSHGSPSRTGVGLFARALMDRFPDLPVEEEGRLCDPVLRDNFVERVFAYRRLRTLLDGRWTLGGLVNFHAAHKLLLMAHSPAGYTSLGRMVARAKGTARRELEETYESSFMAALKKIATRRLHTNVLQHVAGYFKKCLDGPAKEELHSVIAEYHRGLVPLIVPITLIRHHVRTCGVEYLAGQAYLDPHPRELMLRNHV